VFWLGFVLCVSFSGCLAHQHMDVSHTNHMQTLPYSSRDILEHEQLYGNILQAFGELHQENFGANIS